MASAAPSPLAGSTETTNGTKLIRLLVDGGGSALRKIFDDCHPPDKLAANLHSHRSTLDDLFTRGILSKDQMELLFPLDGSNPNSKNFDISLLFLLLTEICKGRLSPPRTGWSNKPHAKNKSEAANIVRIKLFRNKLLHTPETRIDTRVCTQLWKEISGVLVSLGLSQAEINRLEAEPCREDYIDILFKWADREKDMKLKLDEVRQYQKKTHQTLEKVCETQRDQQVFLQNTNKAVEKAGQTQQDQQVLLQNTKEAVDTVSQTQQDQQVLLQDTKEAVQTVSQTQQDQEVFLQDINKAVQTVSQTQQDQQVLLQDTKEAVQTVSQTQQDQQVLLQDTNKAVQTVSQTQQDQQELLQDTKGAVQTVSQTQQDQQVLLQDTKGAVETVSQTQQEQQVLLQTCLNQQVSKSEMETIQVDLQEIKQSMSSLKEEQKREREEETLQNLVKCDFEADIQCYVGRFQEGTRKWVFDKFENWFNDKKSQNRVMVICGNAGMGKSVISAVVCQRMLEAGSPSGCHFIQHNNVRYRKPQLMLQSLACQMCCVHPEFKLALVDQLRRNTGKDLNDMGVEELFALLFKEPLSNVADPGKNMLIVIDGLDESDYQERNELLDVIANHFFKLPPWIRFLVTSRPERNITEALKDLRPFQLESNDEQNMIDIKYFIKKRVECITEAENTDNIVEILAEKSKGLMLYAYFLLLHIGEDPSLLNKPDPDSSLPLGISSVYRSYFKRLETKLMTELTIGEENFLDLLCALAASREPLPTDLVSKVLVPSAKSPLASRKFLKIIDSVSSLLPVRDGCLHVFHKSVKDWLTDKLCYGEHDFTVDSKKGHQILADLCTKELQYLKQRGVHGTKISSAEKYALYHCARHTFQSDMDMRSPGLNEYVQHWLIDLEVLYAKICVDNSMAAEELLWLQRQTATQLLSEENKRLLNTLIFLLRRNCEIFRNRPQEFFQTMLNEGGTVFSAFASNLLQHKYPEIPYMEFVQKQMQQDAIQARFECSSEVACLDVSPQSDYMVCECKDGTIHLWSLNTGNPIWVQPVVKENRYLPGYGAYRMSTVWSLYRSVAFHAHPSGTVVLPGMLHSAYTVDGYLQSLFPESSCTFSVCSITGDKTMMLTDYPDNAKCIVMWSLKDGAEIARTTRKEDVLSFAWSPDGRLVALCLSTGTVCVVDAMNGFTTLAQTSTSEICGLIKFSHDHRFLLCWHVAKSSQKQFLLNIECDKQGTLSLDVNKVSSGIDVSYNPWKFESLSKGGFLQGDPFSSFFQTSSSGFEFLEVGFGFVLNNETVISGHPRFNYVEMLNINKIPHEAAIELHGVKRLAFSLDGETVYGISDSPFSTVMSWDVSSGKLKFEDSRTISDTNLVPQRKGVLFLTISGIIEQWTFDLSKCIRRWTNLDGITELFAISEERVACVTPCEVIILDTVRNKIMSTIPTFDPHFLACNSKFQVLTASDRSILLWDSVEFLLWEKIIPFSHPLYYSFSGMFSPAETRAVISARTLKGEVHFYVLETLGESEIRTLCRKDSASDCKFISEEACVIISFDSVKGHCLQLFNVLSADMLSEIVVDMAAFCFAVCLHRRLIAVSSEYSRRDLKLIRVQLPQDNHKHKGEGVVSIPNKEELKQAQRCLLV